MRLLRGRLNARPSIAATSAITDAAEAQRMSNSLASESAAAPAGGSQSYGHTGSRLIADRKTQDANATMTRASLRIIRRLHLKTAPGRDQARSPQDRGTSR